MKKWVGDGELQGSELLGESGSDHQGRDFRRGRGEVAGLAVERILAAEGERRVPLRVQVEAQDVGQPVDGAVLADDPDGHEDAGEPEARR